MPDYHHLSIRKTLKLLKTSQNGLTQKEAEERLKKFGPNKLQETKAPSRWAIFLNQFKNPLIYVLLIAALISFILQEFIDFSVILAAVVINTILGFIQENKAERTLVKLKEMVPLRTRVLREGRERECLASELARGDILLLEAGDKVPADGRLLEAQNLQIGEAALSGESIPSRKDPKILDKGVALADRENMVYSGTIVEDGKGQAVVVATGAKTELGKIASLVKETPEKKTPLQLKLFHFSKILTLLIGVSCLGIFLVGFFQGRSFFEMFLMAVAIAVAAIPEGLVVGLTVILAIGMQRILKNKALIRKLIAAETLGSTTVICSDKTGTLTEGRMQVAHILTGSEEFSGDYLWFKREKQREREGEDHLLALKISLLCNNAIIENPQEELTQWRILGDPTEKALLSAAIQAGLDGEALNKEMPRVAEIPFDHQRKFMATIHEQIANRKSQIDKRKAISDKLIVYVKGAPEKLLEMAGFVEVNGKKERLTPARSRELKDKYEEMTRRGLRVLAVGYKESSKFKVQSSKFNNLEEKLKDITFVAFIALKDPLRPEAKEVIQLCREAGIRPILLTGDHKLTAQAIAQEIGLEAKEENILTGQELEKIDDQTLKEKIRKVDIYSRVEPRHKLRIIDTLQAKGEVVAMTGDGVNDAPALRSADIGIALGSGTDVARETSDMVLLDNNFKTIVLAIEQGRVIFDNIRKLIIYLLSDSFSEIVIISGSLILGWPLPLLAAQILWINLITDGFPSLALTVEPEERGVMLEPPRKREEAVLSRQMKFLIILISFITGLASLGIFYLIWRRTGDLEKAREVTFVALGIDSLFYVFSCRSLRHSILNKNLFSNRYLLGAVLGGILLQLGAIYLPPLQKIFRTQGLGWGEWGIILLFCLGVILVIEVTKWGFIIKRRKRT